MKYSNRKSIATILRGVTNIWNKDIHPEPDEIASIPSRDNDRTIKAHVYKPPSSETSSSSSQPHPQPVLINFCGSGFTLSTFGTDDEFCRFIATNTAHIVFDVDYRLAPENPFDAAYDDAEDVVQWVRSHPEQFDLDRVSLSGFSAGANLALSITSSSLMFKGENAFKFHAAMSYYGPMDLSQPTPQKPLVDDSNTIIRKIFPHVSHFCHKCLNPHKIDTKDPRISPAFADPQSFPRNVLFVTAAQDPFALEAEQLAEKIRSVEGFHVVCQRMDSCPHGWDKDKLKEGSVQQKSKMEAYRLAVDMLT